jgi:hypothetical protein
MPRFLVEVSEPQAVASRRINRSVKTLGSHFATHANWRQRDGVAIGTMVVDTADRRGALSIVPPAMRADAQIFQLAAAAIGAQPYAPPAHAEQTTAIAA